MQYRDIDLIKIIAQKTGRDYEKTTKIIDKKIGFMMDDNGCVVQLCMNDCNLMNETIPKELWKLVHLNKLYLSTNMISHFPLGILELSRLTHLSLNGNQIRVITGRIKELKLLEYLDLSGNQLETLPFDSGKMLSLKTLRLNSNRVITLPVLNPKEDWLKLESIDLDGADIKEIPTWMFKLQSLKNLSLSKLHLNRFPESICHLRKLERLFIDSTQFLVWPEKIVLPDHMRSIVLDGAYMRYIPQTGVYKIPDAIIELRPKYVRNQKSIDKNDLMLQVSLGGNISAGLDESQLFHESPDIAYNYLKNLYSTSKEENSSEYVRVKDIKVVLLGVGAVGKSSLVQRLCLSNPDDDNIPLENVETTHGVNIDCHMNLCDLWDQTNQKYVDFTVHFWDFGGQDKYRGINKLLMTDKAIYIIVLDSRAQSTPDIWLEMVKIYAPNSKVILVANKIDENARLNINFKYYYEKYPQLYNCFFKISCKYPSRGMNKIADIFYAIKKIVEEQMNILTPVGPKKWLEIQAEMERQHRIYGKVILSFEEYTQICEVFNISEKSVQLQLLTILNTCGSCITIEDTDFSILSPNWIADYLYIFYNNMCMNKAIMDYWKEYISMFQELKEYSEYGEIVTNYLEQRGLCTTFYDKKTKKIFIPMFLPEDPSRICEFPQELPILKYKFSSTVIPEYEFQKFLVREFEKINKEIWEAWQFGLYIKNDEWTVCMELINDGIFLEIWTSCQEKCGRCLQWLRNALQSVASSNFFTEYIFVEHISANKDKRKVWLPYNTLEILNSWNLKFYCLPEEGSYESLIPINIKDIAQKCGLRTSAFEDETINESLKLAKMLEHGDVIMNVDIKEMYGDLKNYETHGENASIIIHEGNDDTILKQEIYNLKMKIDSMDDAVSKKICDDLKILLEELEISNEKDRKSIKERLSNWMSQSANFITFGGALYENREMIFSGIKSLLEMI